MNTENNLTSSYGEQVVSEIISIAKQIYEAFPGKDNQDYVQTVFLATIKALYPK